MLRLMRVSTLLTLTNKPVETSHLQIKLSRQAPPFPENPTLRSTGLDMLNWVTIRLHQNSTNRGFLKEGYPQIIHFSRIFHYKPSILGYPHLWKSPNDVSIEQLTSNGRRYPKTKARWVLDTASAPRDMEVLQPTVNPRSPTGIS